MIEDPVKRTLVATDDARPQVLCARGSMTLMHIVAVGQFVGLAPRADVLLKGDRVEVGNGAEVAHPKLVARHVTQVSVGLRLVRGRPTAAGRKMTKAPRSAAGSRP